MNRSLKLICLYLTFFTSLQVSAEHNFANSFCDSCENTPRMWASADYLYWKMRNSPNPIPLLVTAPFARNRLPLVGQPGTSNVLGGKSVQNHWRSGARFTLGSWIDESCCFGAEANYFFLPHESKTQTAFSSGLPGSSFLSVPYFNTLTRLESSSPVAQPGSFQGFAKLKVSNSLQGAELNGLVKLYSGCSLKIDGLVGFRYLGFKERLKFFVNSPAINIPGEVYQVSDHFHTKNNFYGGQIGFKAEYFYRCFFLSAKAKVALGAMCEKLNIRGKFLTNAFNGFGAPETFSGGYFALPSNIGHHKYTCFAVVPEVNLSLGYQITDCFRIQLGYSFLYVNKLLWAGKQIKRKINPSQSALYEFTPNPNLVGAAKPKASPKNDQFWVHGLNVNLELQF